MSKFTDIVGHWAEADIEEAAMLGLMAGYPDGTFRPEQPVTRAEEAAIEVRQVRRAFATFNVASKALRKMVAPGVIHIQAGGSVGAGVMVAPSGLFLTCAHVVDTADANSSCSFPSWETADGANRYVLGLDVLLTKPEKDIALCRVRWPERAGRMPYVRRSNEIPEPGTFVAAFGSPMGYRAWESLGIIASPLVTEIYYQGLQFMLAVSAAINPGNSGGALVDAASGKLLGIVGAKLVDVAVEGMGFAIASFDFERLLADAVQAGIITPEDLAGEGG